MTARNPHMLLVDDDPVVREVVGRIASDEGFEVVCCASGHEAFDAFERAPVFALVDLRMPEVDGLEVLRALRERVPSCSTALMSGAGTIDEAVAAIKLGALDYLHKPLDFSRLRELLGRVREDVATRRSLLEFDGDVARRLEFCGMIGRSAIMQDAFSLIRRLAPHVRNVLITGETGTGKELVAKAFHTLGPRRDRAFVPVNCSAVVDTLSESELFGHVRGAFTGATDTKVGLFEQADRGTLFLDEIGELPLNLQAKLLRVLETGEIQRVGSVDRRRVDVHVFAATNRDLRTEVSAGRFRTDLLYRLNVIELTLPALRDRREDIPYLLAAFVREVSARLRKSIGGISTDAERALVGAHWEGNVRELRNVVERACILVEGDLITRRDLVGLTDRAAREPASAPGAATPPRPALPIDDRDDASQLDLIEKEHILRVLERVHGNKKAAAELLGISRRKLYRFLERHHIHTPQSSPDT
jgi:two-component system response regulator AtoC